MILRCIAVDDEPPALKIIKEYCSRVPNLDLLACITDPFQAIQTIKTEKPDLLFLDIQMPDIDGISIVKSLDYNPFIIFSTAYSRYAIEGFNLEVVDFLLKPYSFDRFEKAIQKTRKLFEQTISLPATNEGDFLLVKIEYQNVKIPLADIVYIEALDNYIKIHTQTKFYMTLMNLKTIAPKLPLENFVRVHRSFLISLSHISHFTHEVVTLGKYSVPVGRTYLQTFLIAAKKA
jgi:DNA-binding LytR/AlgR family response regulator